MARLTVKQAALQSDVSESLVRRWLAGGELPHFRVGANGRRGKILIDPADLDGLIATFKTGASRPPPAAARPRPALKHVRA